MIGAQCNHFTEGASLVPLAPLPSCLHGYTCMTNRFRGTLTRRCSIVAQDCIAYTMKLLWECKCVWDPGEKQWTTRMVPAEITIFCGPRWCWKHEERMCRIQFSLMTMNKGVGARAGLQVQLQNIQKNSHFCHSSTNNSTMWGTESVLHQACLPVEH